MMRYLNLDIATAVTVAIGAMPLVQAQQLPPATVAQ
jgi:hypothetical protein